MRTGDIQEGLNKAAVEMNKGNEKNREASRDNRAVDTPVWGRARAGNMVVLAK